MKTKKKEIKQIKPIKKKKKTRVYIGGTFDLFHHGHVQLIKYGKSIADEVVVSLNTDEFNLQYKGRKPVMTLEERMIVVEACRYVDKVDVNDGGYDSKPSILRNKPDFILHGDNSVGATEMKRLMIDEEFLKKNKIKLIYFPLVNGVSTTELRRRTRSKSRRQGPIDARSNEVPETARKKKPRNGSKK